MTDTQDFSHLRALAAEWLDRGCDVDDLRCDGGSTSVNKLLRAYVAAIEPTNIIALLDKLEAAQAEVEELERLCDATYVAQGADAYNHACECMEAFQENRRAAGKEVGTTHSLCDGMGWLYRRLDELEAGASPVQPSQAGELNYFEIQAGWQETFSTENTYCPCNLKSFTKAVNWAIAAINAKTAAPSTKDGAA